MKVLVVGCGSIGRRHIHNLVKFDRVDRVYVCTKNRDYLDALEKYSKKILRVANIEGISVDFAVICNETYKHPDISIYLAKKGINLFIEKPLSRDMDDIENLRKIVAKKNIKVAVGYNMRFLGAIIFIKERIAKRDIGDLYFARLEVGQYLPDWRKGRDYRKSYSASLKKGGGVSMDLSHEIDYMRYLFGDPVEYKLIKARVSNLEIDSEDVFEGIYRYKGNFLCSVHMDYLQPRKNRQMHILGSKGSITCDFVKKYIKIWKAGEAESTIKNKEYFDLDITYKNEMKDFIDALGSSRSPRCGMDDGIEALKLIQEKHV